MSCGFVDFYSKDSDRYKNVHTSPGILGNNVTCKKRLTIKIMKLLLTNIDRYKHFSWTKEHCLLLSHRLKMLLQNGLHTQTCILDIADSGWQI